jgi:starch-binding outer membrane protein, SusD/RagB family
MKRYKIILLAMVWVMNSCTKDLVTTDYSEINPSIFPKSASDLEAMVNACYYPLRGAWYDGLFSTSERGVMVNMAIKTWPLYTTSGLPIMALPATTMIFITKSVV